MPINYHSRQKKYPKRNEYLAYIGEGKNFLFTPPNICVSVAWYGVAYGKGGYKITLAFTIDRKDARKYPNYPFIKSAKDKRTVEAWIQKNCDHEWNHWNYHKVCISCQLWVTGDFLEVVLREQGIEAVDLHDDYILGLYGAKGLALRRARAGINDNLSDKK